MPLSTYVGLSSDIHQTTGGGGRGEREESGRGDGDRGRHGWGWREGDCQ